MKARQKKSSEEPMGIVIAVSPSAPTTTVFSEYVWGPAPAVTEGEQKPA